MSDDDFLKLVDEINGEEDRLSTEMNYEAAEQDIDWIINGASPHYTAAKGDNSNMFELSCDDNDIQYINYVISRLNEHGFTGIISVGRFISIARELNSVPRDDCDER